MGGRAVITTQRGNEKYTWEGYLYVKDKVSKSGTVQFWRCEFKNDGCNGRIWTNIEDGSFNCIRKEHSCSTVGNAARVGVQEVNTTVRRLAETTRETPAQIRMAASQNVSDAVRGILSSRNAMSRNIQRRRLNNASVNNIMTINCGESSSNPIQLDNNKDSKPAMSEQIEKIESESLRDGSVNSVAACNQ